MPQEQAEHDAVVAAEAVDADASFGIEEGEVDQLERKWITWCATPLPSPQHALHPARAAPSVLARGRRSYDVEENKRLVLDEVEDATMTPQRLSVWDRSSPRGGGSRARRRTPWGERVVAASPVFYGWVVAFLVALCALVVSPAQVYCVGVVIDAIIVDEELTRSQASGLYATAAALSAPVRRRRPRRPPRRRALRGRPGRLPAPHARALMGCACCVPCS